MEDREWGSQFVGDIGEEVAAELVLAIEVVGHGVERVGQSADLAGRVGQIDAGLAPAGSEIRGRPGERDDGSSDACRDVHGDDEGHTCSEQDAEDRGLGQRLADVEFGVHGLRREAEHDCANGAAIDDHRCRHRVGATGVDRRRAVHASHHADDLVSRCSNDDTVGVGDRQRRLRARCHGCHCEQVGPFPATRAFVRSACGSSTRGEIVLLTLIGQDRHL